MKDVEQMAEDWRLRLDPDRRTGVLATPRDQEVVHDGRLVVSMVVHFLSDGSWQTSRFDLRDAIPAAVKGELTTLAKQLAATLAADPDAFGPYTPEPMTDAEFVDAIHDLLLDPVRSVPLSRTTSAVLRRMLERTGRHPGAAGICQMQWHYGTQGPLNHSKPEAGRGLSGIHGAPTSNPSGLCDDCKEDFRRNYPQRALPVVVRPSHV